MAPVVVVLVALLALALLGAVVAFAVGRVVRHWSRTREQPQIVFAVQMGLIGVVQSAVQRSEAATANGQAAAPPDSQWAAEDAKARAAVRDHVGLLRDPALRQLTLELLDSTGRLAAAHGPAEAARAREEVTRLQAGFQQRSQQVVRELRLGRR